MKFRTEIDIKDSEIKINKEDRIFSIGSCFATEISQLLSKGQLQTFHNPFGTIFNPYSIANAVERLHDAKLYNEEDLINYNDRIISLDHHTEFDSSFAHKTLEKINNRIEEGNVFFQSTDFVIITYGTSFIHEFLPKNKIVANCHKIPGKFFEKRLLSQTEISSSIQKTIQLLKDICTDEVQIFFTVSPVRHTKDGMVENNLSKAKLITAIHETILAFTNCHYLPIYEIMMDDLRDYRFYKEDMIHPSSQAVNYIFQKFGNAFFSDETMDFVEENFKISQALNHKTSDEKSPKHLEFLAKLKQRITAQQGKVKHKIFDVEIE
ncbi:MAG: GSCFA domain-containing protein [Cruoricaptor ignavus]|nr:GSCFA domain-containing protein [Cruoricaptor ignavus]